MPDLHDQFRVLDQIPAPDLRDEVVRLGSVDRRVPSPWRRISTIVLAGTIAAAGVVFAARALLDTQEPVRPGPPADTSPTVGPRVTTTIRVGRAGSLVAGEGSLWVAVSADDGTTGGHILRIDPGTGDVLATITVDAVPTWETGGGGLAVGQGSVWVAARVDTPGGPNSPGSGFEAVLLQIDPATNEVVARVELGGDSAADVAVDASSVWVSMFDDSYAPQVVRVSPDAGRVVATIPLEAGYARHIFSAGGWIWVHEREVHGDIVSTSVLTKIDPATDRVIARVPLETEAAFAAGDGVIWAAVGDSMVKIDPATAELVGDQIAFGGTFFGHVIVAGEGGVWFMGDDPASGAAIGRLDPDSGEVDASVPLGPEAVPIAMTVAPGSIWVLTYDGSLIRISAD